MRSRNASAVGVLGLLAPAPGAAPPRRAPDRPGRSRTPPPAAAARPAAASASRRLLRRLQHGAHVVRPTGGSPAPGAAARPAPAPSAGPPAPPATTTRTPAPGRTAGSRRCRPAGAAGSAAPRARSAARAPACRRRPACPTPRPGGTAAPAPGPTSCCMGPLFSRRSSACAGLQVAGVGVQDVLVGLDAPRPGRRWPAPSSWASRKFRLMISSSVLARRTSRRSTSASSGQRSVRVYRRSSASSPSCRSGSMSATLLVGGDGPVDLAGLLLVDARHPQQRLDLQPAVVDVGQLGLVHRGQLGPLHRGLGQPVQVGHHVRVGRVQLQRPGVGVEGRLEVRSAAARGCRRSWSAARSGATGSSLLATITSYTAATRSHSPAVS